MLGRVLFASGVIGFWVAVFGVWILYKEDRRLSGKPLGLLRINFAFIQDKINSFRQKKNNQVIMEQWPTLLESMSVAVKAGLNIVDAFEVCTGKTYGPLRVSAEKVIVRLRSGMSMSAALSVMEKEGIQAAKRLKTTLSQAESLGTPISDVLEALSAEYYTLERQRFESKLNSLPIKLSLITVVFLLPPVLIISVMPHVLSFIQKGL